ncbi:MAG TPA: DUF4941 domain-containing protein [Pseudothermotoga sp.]
MKKAVFFFVVFVAVSCFSFDLYIGKKLMYSSADLENTMNWASFVSFMENYARIIGIDSLSTGEIGDFQYLVWNGHTVGFAAGSSVFVVDGVTIKNKAVPVDVILSAFQLPFIKEESGIVLADMIINRIIQTDDIIDITYSGSNGLVFTQKQNQIDIVSDGFVTINGQIYKPGQSIMTVQTDKKIEQKIEMPGLIRIVLMKETFSTGEIVLLNFDQASEIPEDGVLLFYSNGDDRIIIRPYSPDFEGSDWPIYAQNKKIAQQIAARFNLKLEICPLYCLPVGRMSMVLLLSDDTKISQIEDYIKELLQ